MKPFAIILLDSLKVRTFDHKDEWLDAIEMFARSGKQIIALKWHEGAKLYQQPEVCAIK